jgi:gamma-glutamyltranspeptidase/glutathione hydrolase/leukotriene-C4 hydrolase
VAPGASTWDMLKSGDYPGAKKPSSTFLWSAKRSILAAGYLVGVPGEIAGLHAAWKMFGRVPWKRLFEPAIDLCLYGYRLSSVLEQKMNLSLGAEMDPSF